jgi:hypothetical protein
MDSVQHKIGIMNKAFSQVFRELNWTGSNYFCNEGISFTNPQQGSSWSVSLITHGSRKTLRPEENTWGGVQSLSYY